MKLSLATSALGQYFNARQNRMDILDTVAAIRSCGFTCMDYGIPEKQLGDDWMAQADALNARLTEYGMIAAQAHAPFSALSPRSEAYKALCRRALQFCARAGIPMMVLHPIKTEGCTREEFLRMNMAYYRELMPTAEKTGVQVLVENVGLPGEDYYLRNGVDLRAVVDAVAHPLCNACWDVGHGNFYNDPDCNLYDTIVTLGEKLKALHIHDNCGNLPVADRPYRMDMHMMPFMTPYATVNYDALLQGLVDIGYTGTFNFETDAPRENPHRMPFIYEGKRVRRIEGLPPELWRYMNHGLYLAGKYMLETYGVFEE
jgi:sugar phosphate isomerase/epimerase